jgi:hypothetical protein
MVTIHCTRCGRQEASSCVGVDGGSWKQQICPSCYVRLARSVRQEAGSTSKKNSRAGSAGKKNARAGTARYKNKKSTPQVTRAWRSARDIEYDRSRRQFPGIGHLLEFFQEAHVIAELLPDERLRLNSIIIPLQRGVTLPSSGVINWDSVIDDMAVKYAAGIFAETLREQPYFPAGLHVVAIPEEKGFEVSRAGVKLAVIRATHATVGGRVIVKANFLRRGPHWHRLADAISSFEWELSADWRREQAVLRRERESKHVKEKTRRREATGAASTKPKVNPGKHFTVRRELPTSIDPALADACINASRRIRLERQVAYERPVSLQYAAGTLMLRPIVHTGSRLQVPFRLDMGRASIDGDLILADHDPLPLLIGVNVTDEDVITAWAGALIGFADITCVEIELSTSRPSERRQRSQAAAHRSQREIPTAPRRHPWPSHLEPIGEWAQYSGSFVAGHRRHLPEGWTASDTARERARRIGIVLRVDETWVKPHARGIPEGTEMRFRWRAPEVLGTRI